jgi:DNA-binding NarL/FixJ family response regulator
VLEAVRRLAAGRSHIKPEMAREYSSPVRSSESVITVRSRDFEILRLVADGSWLTEIAEAIGISDRIVADQCRRLKAKLAAPWVAALSRVRLPRSLAAATCRTRRSATGFARPARLVDRRASGPGPF